ncbi:MAG: transketolase C-terminal domain-containing protein, partial [Clostridia bacterium]
PYFAVYSTFLQRAFDNLLHDVCLNKLPFVIGVDRAGFVSGDGETHQGIYDISFLSCMPNMTIFAPKDCEELAMALNWSEHFDAPLAIRYPKGCAKTTYSIHTPIEYGKFEALSDNDAQIVLLANGATILDELNDMTVILGEKNIKVDIVNCRFIRPLDTEYLDKIANKTIVTVEENVIEGGFGSAVATYYIQKGKNVDLHICAVENKIYPQASREELLKETKLDAQSMANFVLNLQK